VIEDALVESIVVVGCGAGPEDEEEPPPHPANKPSENNKAAINFIFITTSPEWIK
jgi:hypothetical protein